MGTAPQPAAARRRTRLRARLLLAIATVMVTLAAIEGGLWLFHPLGAEPRKRINKFLPSYYAMSPAPRVFDFDPGPLTGVSPGIRHLRVNSYGFLYAEEQRRRSSAAEVRIAAVGGSTVECAALPEAMRWTAVLEQLLQREVPEHPVTVLNLGLSAIDSRTHLATTCQHITGLDVDLVVFMLGANDLSRFGDDDLPLLSPDCFYDPPKVSRVLADLLQQTQIGRHASYWRDRWPEAPRRTPYFEKQVRFQAALPQLAAPLLIGAAGLDWYARNIVSLAGVCQAHGVAALFTTQPTMLTRSPTPEEEAVLWSMHTGSHRVSPANFVDLLDALNRCLMATCAQREYPCLDLAQAIPKGLGCFYDQVHFNETGARMVAAALVPRVHALLGRRLAGR